MKSDNFRRQRGVWADTSGDRGVGAGIGSGRQWCEIVGEAFTDAGPFGHVGWAKHCTNVGRPAWGGACALPEWFRGYRDHWTSGANTVWRAAQPSPHLAARWCPTLLVSVRNSHLLICSRGRRLIVHLCFLTFFLYKPTLYRYDFYNVRTMSNCSSWYFIKVLGPSSIKLVRTHSVP